MHLHPTSSILPGRATRWCSAEALPYVFERFYRVDPSRARKSGGSGIGLTIARHLVWSMGGELTATSDGPGRGSTFAFTLPAPFQPHPAG